MLGHKFNFRTILNFNKNPCSHPHCSTSNSYKPWSWSLFVYFCAPPMFGIVIIYLLLYVCVWNERVREWEREREEHFGVYGSFTQQNYFSVGIFCCVVSTESTLRQPWQPQKHYALFKWNGVRYFNMWIFQFNVFFFGFCFVSFSFSLTIPFFLRFYFYTNRWVGMDVPAYSFTTYE